jgi:methylmalonyl-CoA/ethylmalonyl-CoA epimerase
VIKITDLNQVCMVVNDLDKSMASLWRTFGMGPWDIHVRDYESENEAESIRDMTYYGKPAQFSYKMASTHDKFGGVFIELIQPVAGDNIYRDFLKKNGEGIHHLGWHVVESQEAFAETWKRLEEGGFPCMMSARLYHTAVAYFDTTKVLGTILEVVWRDPARIHPAPVRVFPES